MGVEAGTATAGRAASALAALRSAVSRVGAWRAAFGAALEEEAAHRRFFLWVPVAMGAGVVLYFVAAREPSRVATLGLTLLSGVASVLARRHRRLRTILVALACVFAGMATAGLRTARLAAPVLDRMRIVTLQGYVEEMDLRREGARFLLRVAASDGLDVDKTPYRVRLTTRRPPEVAAGDFVEVKARLLPPARAAAPGAYDFARDAWFARIGAVGSVLGAIETAEPPEPPDLDLRIGAAIDRARNALAQRVDAVIGGEAGAIGAAMVTGKRDLLSEETKDVIRQAGIFHVITISGVQMTLVAGIFFVGLRRLLALSQTLALRHPIKKWAAATAMLGAIVYDILTGSRVGTERALFMTLIMLTAVLLDRQALTMRNLALAALCILVVEPEAILGASFQLSFAAVGALVAVYEARAARHQREVEAGFAIPSPPKRGRLPRLHGPGQMLAATFFATCATASFMAYDFHEMNPYVLVGNPLTLAVIELFAVPGAIVGTILYPLGLDGFVWHYVGAGIALIMWAARLIGALPGATLHLPAFAPWSLAALALAVVSAVIWRSTLLRLTALAPLCLGLAGAAAGPAVDVAVAPSGDAVAVRGADGRLAVVGRRPSAFAAEQWLRADADGRAGKGVVVKQACDGLGCVARLADGRAVAVVLDSAAFAEDCLRASIVVTPLYAPIGCAAPVVIDRGTLRRTGAVALRATADGFVQQSARAPDEDRPWSPAPPPRWRYAWQAREGAPPEAAVNSGE